MATFAFLDALGALEQSGGVIAFPTDTVYGMGCMVDKPEAIEKIYRMKGRDEAKPLILLGYDTRSFEPYLNAAKVPEKARQLMARHWPGPLTLVLPKSSTLSDGVTRHLDTIGIRVPDCATLRNFLALVPGGLLATTSANRSGELPCTTADHVIRTFGDDLGYVIADDDAIQSGQPSTVAGVSESGEIRIFRQGTLVLD